MRTVTYQSVLDLAATHFQGHAERIDAKLAASLGRFINSRVRAAWAKAYWPFLTPTEERQFRPDWVTGTAYAAPTATAAVERYHVPSETYYQTLKAGTSQEPADVDGNVNYAYWYPAQADYAADDWLTGGVYTSGSSGVEPSLVRNPADDRVYACLTSHTAGATFAGDAAKWGVLTPFVRNIEYEQSGETAIGEVAAVWDRDPAVYLDACPLGHVLREDDFLVRHGPPIVWVEFKRQVPRFEGDAYSATATYAVDEQMFYTDGDYYRCLTPTSAGESPDSAPTKWSLREFPWAFQECVAQGAHADMLKADGLNDTWRAEDRIAQDLLHQELQKYERQQRQSRPLLVGPQRR